MIKSDVGHDFDLDNVVDNVHRDVDDSYDEEEDDDMYIMMKCLCVCLFVTKNDHFLLGVHNHRASTSPSLI